MSELITPGEFIPTELGYLRGHGTRLYNNNLVSTIAGSVTRINKLISVNSFNSRYNGEVGDVIVGRVAEILDKKWKIDIQARADSVLHLSSVILPGGQQRRRTAEDALSMRSLFKEGDLLSAEIQAVHNDGSVSLHTRSAKYGKLENGCLVIVPQGLVKRCKQHFMPLEDTGIVIILGNNGYIWLSRDLSEEEKKQKEEFDTDESGLVPKPQLSTGPAQRLVLTRVRNAILALSLRSISIHPKTIMSVIEDSVDADVKDMLNEEVRDRITINAKRIAANLQ